MALHCFNLFFPCTNILQVKCMHRPRSLYCTFKVAAKFATISRLFSDQAEREGEVCVRNIRGARGMWPGWRPRGRDCAGCKVYVRPISSHSYWLECWQCRQECGDRSTLSHTHTHKPAGEARASAKHNCQMGKKREATLHPI